MTGLRTWRGARSPSTAGLGQGECPGRRGGRRAPHGVGAGPRVEWGALAALPAPTQGLARVCEAWRGASLVPSAGPSPACGGAGGASNDPESPEGVPAPATAG